MTTARPASLSNWIFDIGRDGKATIINFRHASCLPPATKIGLSGCSTYDFQLEMRQVKFLLDYQDAREAEYRLAEVRRSATRLNAREGVTAPVRFGLYGSLVVDADLCTLVTHT